MGSERSGTAASSRERSSSSPASADRRRSSRRGGRDLALGVGDVDAAAGEVLLEQLHRALQHRQRRAQLVRRGRDERPPGGLLAAQLLLHAGQRAGEVADLVAALVVRHGGASGRPRVIRSAALRSRPSRRSSVLESAVASSTATSRPTPAAARNALRT
jgi:hypothetical protein